MTCDTKAKRWLMQACFHQIWSPTAHQEACLSSLGLGEQAQGQNLTVLYIQYTNITQHEFGNWSILKAGLGFGRKNEHLHLHSLLLTAMHVFHIFSCFLWHLYNVLAILVIFLVCLLVFI